MTFRVFFYTFRHYRKITSFSLQAGASLRKRTTKNIKTFALLLISALLFVNFSAEISHVLPRHSDGTPVFCTDQHTDHADFAIHDYLCVACIFLLAQAGILAHDAWTVSPTLRFLIAAKYLAPFSTPHAPHFYLRAPPSHQA